MPRGSWNGHRRDPPDDLAEEAQGTCRIRRGIYGGRDRARTHTLHSETIASSSGLPVKVAVKR